MTPAHSEVTVFHVENTLDMDTAPHMKDRFLSVLTRPGNVVLDLRRATLDSTGLGAVLSLQRLLDVRGRRLLVVADDPRFLSLLQHAGVEHALTLYPTAELALQCASHAAAA